MLSMACDSQCDCASLFASCTVELQTVFNVYLLLGIFNILVSLFLQGVASEC